MAFDDYGSSVGGGESNFDKIDYTALNKYIAETVDCTEPQTYNGFISNLVDLGTQIQPLADYPLAEEDVGLSVEELNEKYKDDFFVEGASDYDNHNKIVEFGEVYDNQSKKKVLRKRCYQKPRQSIVFAVDFPDIQVDYGQFFGYEKDEEGNDIVKTVPYRMWYGGEFWMKSIGKMVVQNVIPLKKIKDDKMGYTMNPKSLPYKLAIATEVIKTGEAFDTNRVDELLGKTAQFQIHVYTEDFGGKTYLKEKLKFVGKIQKKDKPFEDVEKTLIQFNKDNDVEAVKRIRASIINTLMLATNFEGSAIQEQLKEAKPYLFETTKRDDNYEAQEVQDFEETKDGRAHV